MIHICSLCQAPIEHDDQVTMAIESVYKRLQSVNTFALSQEDLVYIIDTLAHKRCKSTEDYYGF